MKFSTISIVDFISGEETTRFAIFSSALSTAKRKIDISQSTKLIFLSHFINDFFLLILTIILISLYYINIKFFNI